MFDGHPTNDTKRGGSQRDAQLRDRTHAKVEKKKGRNRDGMTLLRLQKETHEVRKKPGSFFWHFGRTEKVFSHSKIQDASWETFHSSKLLGSGETSSAVEVAYESHTPKLRMSYHTILVRLH